MQFRLRLALLLLLIFLAALLNGGCSHVPVATLYKLMTFDFAHANPAAIRAAIRVPDALEPRPSGAKLTLTRSGTSSAPIIDTFILEEVTDARELYAAKQRARAGYPITAYKLSPPDVARMKALQGQINADRAAGNKNAAGSLGVSIDACARKPLPQGALLSSTYLKLEDEADYMPVVEDLDLRKEIPPEQLAKQIPPCAARS